MFQFKDASDLYGSFVMGLSYMIGIGVALSMSIDYFRYNWPDNHFPCNQGDWWVKAKVLCIAIGIFASGGAILPILSLLVFYVVGVAVNAVKFVHYYLFTLFF